MTKKRKTTFGILIFALLVVLLFLLEVCYGTTVDAELLKEIRPQCPLEDDTIYENSILSGARNAGTHNVIHNATEMSACVRSCCSNVKCHVAVMLKNHCVNVECKNAPGCQVTNGSGSSLVFVRKISDDAEWVAQQSDDKTHMDIEDSGTSANQSVSDNKATSLPSTDTRDRRCEYGLRQCGKNEECVPFGDRRRDGLCHCLTGFIRSETGECVDDAGITTATEGPDTTTTIESESKTADGQEVLISHSSTSPSSLPTTIKTASESSSTTTSPNSVSPKPVEKLVVSVNNKTVYLAPGSAVYEDRITLSAYAIGGVTDLKYEWSLLQPDKVDQGSISDTKKPTVTLSHLAQGVYIFKVIVDAPGVHGEAVGNVTVHPAKRTNQPPEAIIVPSSQEIKLPSSQVIIDGSPSRDDAGIASYHWEMVTAPLGYKFNDETGTTLKLTDLIPGNYTVMLRVKDEEGLEGNTTTFISVLKETDYPPSANAGGDQIVYLPKTEIILYGNSSTDDHGIEEWEWTKGPQDSGKAVDMQDTRTPFLHLSNLEEGHYQFILRVTDGLGQSSNTPVYVYVQKPNLTLPKANAGVDIQLVLPNTTTVLDGSHSGDTASATHWLWKQLSGPNTAHLSKINEEKITASGLTKGSYVFCLTVWNGDDPLKNTTDNVTVTVTQDRNVPPKANAGGDFSVTLPVSVIVVDGSGSSDDVAVTKWKWERDATSLAAGKVINDSDYSSVLLFTDVVAGGYVWKLTVWDDQGATSSDTVSIIVKEGRHHLDEVELLVCGDIGSLSYSQLSTLLQKLELFLHTNDRVVTIHLLSFTGLPHSGKVSLTFLAYSGKEVVKGTEVVSLLRHQVIAESPDLLDLPLLSVDTVVCQNDCSGHGECIQATRECRCHTWWMESFFRRHMGDGVQNCDWSVVYVFVTIFVIVLATGLIGWMIASLLVRKLRGNLRPRRKPPRYSLLDGHEEGIKLKTRVPGNLLDSGSESDSEAEVLYDSRKPKHKSDKPRNGYHKLTRLRT